jgi:sulfonate transport system ATP-binding protein
MSRLLNRHSTRTPTPESSTPTQPALMDTNQSPRNASDRRGTEIELIGVSKTFGQTTVLHKLDLRVSAGEFVAVVGRSGCGKSTLLRIVAGLERPSGGRLLVNGEPLDGLNRQARMMFQDARLLPWRRVGENVAVGQGGRVDEAVRVALERVNLGTRAPDWPAVLSGGQRQRVALARALVGNPPLLLLDEPLGALDALTRMEMQTLIHDLWWGTARTAILVTHDIEEAALLADRVLFIDEGRIQAEFAVDTPRPRDRTTADFQSLVRRVLNRVLLRD